MELQRSLEINRVLVEMALSRIGVPVARPFPIPVIESLSLDELLTAAAMVAVLREEDVAQHRSRHLCCSELQVRQVYDDLHGKSPRYRTYNAYFGVN